MGLFEKVANAKPAAGQNYAKPGRYWVLCDFAKKDSHQVDGKEFMAIETKVIHVLDAALKEGKPQAPSLGEPVSFVFKDGVLGNEGRLKSFIMSTMNCTNDEVTGEALNELVDPKLQPMKDVVIEIFAAPQKTRSQKDIVGSRVIRRVPATEVKATLPEQVVNQLLEGGKRLDRMLTGELAEAAAAAKSGK